VSIGRSCGGSLGLSKLWLRNCELVEDFSRWRKVRRSGRDDEGETGGVVMPLLSSERI
jgi:hypothetical protein